MNKPKKPAKNEVVYNYGNAIIVRNETEEFGVSYYVFSPNRFGTINFNTLEEALKEARGD